jgi:hypothetical protein
LLKCLTEPQVGNRVRAHLKSRCGTSQLAEPEKAIGVSGGKEILFIDRVLRGIEPIFGQKNGFLSQKPAQAIRYVSAEKVFNYNQTRRM